MRNHLPLLVGPLLAGAGLAGCTVGPDYKAPPATAADAVARGSFVRAADPAFVPAPGLARWWETLADPTLTALVDDALAHSPTIDQATARIRSAQAQLTQQRTAQLPGVSGNATYLHATLPGVDLGQGGEGGGTAQGSGGGSSGLDFYNLGLTATWELDLFGGGRRGVERDARHGRRARRRSGGCAGHALRAGRAGLCRLARRAGAYPAEPRIDRLAAAAGRARAQRYAGGTASLLDVERLRNQLESTQADAIPLGTQRDEYLNQLAVLTGRTPGALDATLGTVVTVPLPPAQVAIGDPAAVIANRPDIRAAERTLAANTAAIGVNRAKELPGIRFLGLLGLGGTSPGDMFDPGNLTTLLAPSLNWSLLDFGRNRAATRVSEADRDVADAAYRRTVLGALQDAENALSRFGNARAQLGQLAQVEATATRSARLNAQRVQAGTASLIDQLDIERQQLSAAIATGQARAQLTQSYIAVNKALGLGWSAPIPGPGPTPAR